MNVAIVSDNIRLNINRESVPTNFNLHEYKTLNEVSWEIVKQNGFEFLCLFKKGIVDSNFRLILNQMMFLYPKIKVLVVLNDPSQFSEFDEQEHLQLMYIPSQKSVKHVLRRLINYIQNAANHNRLPIIGYRDILLNPNNLKVRRANKIYMLKRNEFNLLELFLNYPKRIFNHTELLELVWNYRYDMPSNTVQVHVAKLRRTINKGFPKKYIHTLYGKGYRFN